MSPEVVISIGQQALEVTILLAAPMLISVLIVGILVGMFQAATSINEMTLSFIPKLIALALVLMIMGSWMITVITDYMIRVMDNIPNLIS